MIIASHPEKWKGGNMLKGATSWGSKEHLGAQKILKNKIMHWDCFYQTEKPIKNNLRQPLLSVLSEEEDVPVKVALDVWSVDDRLQHCLIKISLQHCLLKISW